MFHFFSDNQKYIIWARKTWETCNGTQSFWNGRRAQGLYLNWFNCLIWFEQKKILLLLFFSTYCVIYLIICYTQTERERGERYIEKSHPIIRCKILTFNVNTNLFLYFCFERLVMWCLFWFYSFFVNTVFYFLLFPISSSLFILICFLNFPLSPWSVNWEFIFFDHANYIQNTLLHPIFLLFFFVISNGMKRMIYFDKNLKYRSEFRSFPYFWGFFFFYLYLFYFFFSSSWSL